MDREISQDERQATQQDSGERNRESRELIQKPTTGGRDVALSRERGGHFGPTYAYQISSAELELMYDIGRFRTVAVGDLSAFRYGGDTAGMRDDLESLSAQGLVQRRTTWTNGNKRGLGVVVLTKRGQEILGREAKTPVGQQIYSGFVKPGEVAHDAAIYRMFQAERRQIEKADGQVRRVVLDYELKQKVYSPLAKVKGLPTLEYARRQAEVAQANGLKVLEGRIPLPDLRIEYETAAGQIAKVDLELATHHYHGEHVSSKAQAGFKIYAADGSASRLTAALEERDIVVSILSL